MKSIINNFVNDLKVNFIFYFTVISLLFFYFFVEIKIPYTKYAVARPYTLILLLLLIFAYKKEIKSILTTYKKELLFFLIFLAINILSLIINFNDIKIIEGFYHIIGPSLIFLIFLIIFRKKQNYKNFEKILICLSYILFIINLLLLTKPYLYSYLYAHAQTYPRLGSIFQSPIGLGVFSVIIYILLLTNFQNFQNKTFYYLSIIVNSLNLIFSGAKISFGLYIFFSIIGFYFIFVKNKDYKNLFFHFLIIFLMGVFFYFLWLSPKNLILSSMVSQITSNVEFSQWVENFYTYKTYKETSINRRIEIWAKSISYLLQNPYKLIFGFGPFAFNKYLFPQYNHSHNIFLEFLINYGVIGLAYLIVFIFLIFKKLQAIKSLTLSFIFSYFLIHSFFDLLFWGGVLDILFFGFLIRLINEKK